MLTSRCRETGKHSETERHHNDVFRFPLETDYREGNKHDIFVDFVESLDAFHRQFETQTPD